MSKWIRKGDRIVVIAGNDKGKTGEVLGRVGDRVLVQGVNVRKKHLRRTQETQGGRIVDMEVPIHVSNVSLCTKDATPFRPKVKIQADGSRDLVYHEAGKEIVYRSVKKPA
ncbi:MAG: 50S ribosomal protein L24 [Chlamydiales bacterium]|nr:50S ribosomal protein L24 [Chlamydiales bacterium]